MIILEKLIDAPGGVGAEFATPDQVPREFRARVAA